MNSIVSVIVPLRNEEKHISECIESIIAQSYPAEKLEVLLVDGRSEDNTRQMIEKYLRKHHHIKLMDNPHKNQAVGMNIGIKASKGDIIIRMDAHTYYDNNYISKCVETLTKVDAYNVGGPIVTLPGDDTFVAKAIALATSHPFGVGNSKFRTSNRAEYVDTVTFGAFKKEIFDKVGLFNEKLIRNQDIELNSRIRRYGGKIYLSPEIKSYYYNRSTLKGLWEQNFRNGMWNIFTHAVSHNPLSLRHYVPFIFVSSLIISGVLSLMHPIGLFLFFLVAVSYFLSNLFFSIKIGMKQGMNMVPFLIMAFFTLHFSYGAGSIFGILRVNNWKKEINIT